ncbi:MAG: hypothetical protein ACLGHG_05885 [Gammaproteobacteria bacterium]
MRPQTALLARPHPAIVDTMREAVTACGLTPHALSSREELLQWPPADVALIVVSTSVHSAVQESFEDTIRAARRAHPKAPLVIATVVEPDHARKVLGEMLVLYRIEGRLRTAAELAVGTHEHSEDHDILLVNRQELEQADSRVRVVNAMARLVDGMVVGT